MGEDEDDGAALFVGGGLGAGKRDGAEGWYRHGKSGLLATVSTNDRGTPDTRTHADSRGSYDASNNGTTTQGSVLLSSATSVRSANRASPRERSEVRDRLCEPDKAQKEIQLIRKYATEDSAVAHQTRGVMVAARRSWRACRAQSSPTSIAGGRVLVTRGLAPSAPATSTARL